METRLEGGVKVGKSYSHVSFDVVHNVTPNIYYRIPQLRINCQLLIYFIVTNKYVNMIM